MCEFIVMLFLRLSPISPFYSSIIVSFGHQLWCFPVHIWLSRLELLIDRLNRVNCVWASRQTNKFVKFMQFSKTLNCKYCKIILFVALTLCCASNLTAVCISQKTDKSYLKKSYKEYSVSDISRSVYVAIMWKCLSRWFICIVIIISLRSPQLICDGLEPLTSRPTALGRVFPTFACGPKSQYVS